MAQQIKQNGKVILSAPGDGNPSGAIIFNNLTGVNFSGNEYFSGNYKNYLSMMFHDFPELTYGEIELWEDGELKEKGNINH